MHKPVNSEICVFNIKNSPLNEKERFQEIFANIIFPKDRKSEFFFIFVAMFLNIIYSCLEFYFFLFTIFDFD